MTHQEKQLLLKDLCAKLPYETWVQYEEKEWLVTGYGHGRVSLLPSVFSSAVGPCPLVEEVKPYLRPMSSMAEEEKEIYSSFAVAYGNSRTIMIPSPIAMDYLLSHNFDVRGLIPRGLALEAPTDMYKTE